MADTKIIERHERRIAQEMDRTRVLAELRIEALAAEQLRSINTLLEDCVAEEDVPPRNCFTVPQFGVAS